MPDTRETALPTPLPAIAALPAYVPGARGSSAVPPVKLSSNESPDGPVVGVVDAAAAASEAIHRYPDMAATEITAAIAASLDRDPAEVVVGAGSVAVLAHLLQAYAGPGDEVIFAWRSFEAYPILTAVAGATAVKVPLTAEARHDLPAMAAAVTDATRVVMLCSPNNPTGPTISTAELEEFMAAVPTRVLVVLDEAYVEYVRAQDAVSGPAVLDRHPNLLLLRTFSKAYALAGLRVGYAVGPAGLIAPIRACVTPFSVSGPAQAGALAALAARETYLERAAAVVAERERVAAALRADGWTVPDAQGNFVWLPVGPATLDLVKHLGASEPAILVRPFAGEGVRVTIGAPAENDALLARLGSWQGPRAAT
ncbi:histidinol-phosphate transaminase [Demequina sp. SYSU T00039]|uniref:Aromatic amino acid aminotransferase n=1 Tax=Demequina lignilytica TaxID=3051663 RepID=A0AAW7M3P2_9MICO|nr:MULTISPECIES: histidinol-phosphate transaminase [unclassified Demequina]MDN4477871.1 histidinol-phosphate transaminase [Demequina sp. SYSU T00039-1]MDN4487780.1 histidinol-phosphate transaminase [Demequina sp. SYSU T00039]MDN4490837.1 histidinol-phosphate transaminase [Demequina sp. SYSU T00068]